MPPRKSIAIRFDIDDSDAELSGSNAGSAAEKEEHTQLSRSQPASSAVISAELYKSDLSFYRWLADIRSATEMCAALLKRTTSIFDSVQAAAIFLWQEETRSLVCQASENFLRPDKEGSNRELYIQLRKQRTPVKMKSSVAAMQEPTHTRLVVPILLDADVFGFLYLRVQCSPSQMSDQLIQRTYDTLRLAAPLLSHNIMRKKMDGWIQGMVETILATIGAKDTYTVGHSERVCRFSVTIGRQLGLKGEDLNRLMFSSLIHDIGKVGIPDDILKKAGLLSSEEFEIMRQHPVIGSNMIASMPMSAQIMSGIKYHHERWDGTGYPDGLEGESIPLFGRIVALADAFDAMTSGRSYSGYLSTDVAVEQLEEKPDLFDPDIIAAFVKAYNSGDLTIRTGTALNRLDEPYRLHKRSS